MTQLEILKKQIEEMRRRAFDDSCFGSRELQLQYQGQLNAYDLVLMMIEKLEESGEDLASPSIEEFRRASVSQSA